jgi:hypothetical protein
MLVFRLGKREPAKVYEEENKKRRRTTEETSATGLLRHLHAQLQALTTSNVLLDRLSQRSCPFEGGSGEGRGGAEGIREFGCTIAQNAGR